MTISTILLQAAQGGGMGGSMIWIILILIVMWVQAATVEVEVSNGVILTVEKSMIQPAPEEKK